MAAYLDTSVLVPLFFNEAGTAAARTEVARDTSVWISYWTLAEFSSAIAFKLRSGQTDAATAATARLLFDGFLASHLTVVDVQREDFVNAAHLCASTPSLGLRTPDALHLAVAQRLGLTMVSFDAGLISACCAQGTACRGG